MKRTLQVVVAFVAVAMVPSQALGFCSEPTAPNFYGTKPTEPYKPYCINEFSNTHTCSDWEIDSYNDDVEQYNNDLQAYQWEAERYVNDLKQYIDEAVGYAECEIRNL